MKNIDRIRAMDAAQLAEFLTENGAEVPTEFCDVLCAVEDCDECGFCGAAGDKEAWKIWLESEYDGEEKEDDQEPQEPESIQTDEQDTPEQERSTKENDGQGAERSAGSGPADRREL